MAKDNKTSPRQLAVALGYKPGEDIAPKVLAKGRGPVAEAIVALAEQTGVPVTKDQDLVTLLGKLDVNEDIPEELYQVVAEVLAFVYRMNRLMA